MTYKPLSDEDVSHARTALDDMDDFARMTLGVAASGAMKVLTDFIERAAVLAHVSAPLPASDEAIETARFNAWAIAEDISDELDTFGVNMARAGWMARARIASAAPLPVPGGWEITTPIEAGLSWSGFNLYGDKKSIDRAKQAIHDSDVWVPCLRAKLEKLRAAPTAAPLPVEPEPRNQSARIAQLEAAIVLMSDDGWLLHGAEGMSEAQQACYDAYLSITQPVIAPALLPVEPEPVAWMWQHDETGMTGFVSHGPDLERWEGMNWPRKIVLPLFRRPDAQTLAAIRQGIEALKYHTAQTRPIDRTDAALASLQAAERAIMGETPTLQAELAQARKSLDEWVAANAPGGWIDQARKDAAAGLIWKNNYETAVLSETDALDKLQAARKDAERYRWLRSQYWSDRGLCVVVNPAQRAAMLGLDCPSHERLDAAIDAAMQAQEPTP